MGIENTNDLEKRLNDIKAIDIMSKFAITITENDTISSMAHLMMRFKISGVPVLSKIGDVVGIVTATDLFNLMKAITTDIDNGLELLKYQNIKVNAIMSKDVISINDSTTLYQIIRIMCSKNIHTLPVVVINDSKIVGIIGRRDIINAFYVPQQDK